MQTSITYMLAVCSALSGCSAYEAIGTYAHEHNLFGERVCDSSIKGDETEHALDACPTGAVNGRIGDIPDAIEKEKDQEEAL